MYFIDMNADPVITDVARCITARQDSGVSNHRGEHSAVLIEDAPRAIAGPFFICGTTEEDFRGLTDSEVDLYMDRFKEPEQISPEEVSADTGCTIIFSM